MGFKDMLERFKARKEKFRAFEEEQKMIKKFEEKQKSANERELERFMKEEREDNIKTELEEFRSKRQLQAKGDKILAVKNVFKGNKNEILNNPQMFTSNSKDSIKAERSLFFKN